MEEKGGGRTQRRGEKYKWTRKTDAAQSELKVQSSKGSDTERILIAHGITSALVCVCVYFRLSKRTQA